MPGKLPEVQPGAPFHGDTREGFQRSAVSWPPRWARTADVESSCQTEFTQRHGLAFPVILSTQRWRRPQRKARALAVAARNERYVEMSPNASGFAFVKALVR